MLISFLSPFLALNNKTRRMQSLPIFCPSYDVLTEMFQRQFLALFYNRHLIAGLDLTGVGFVGIDVHLQGKALVYTYLHLIKNGSPFIVRIL